jgi:V/A-type H+-transporting ATPase subunit I
VWGILTASFFGFNISGWMGLDRPLVTVNTLKQNMDFLMRVSFILAAIHLSAAHLWRAKGNFPKPRFLGEIGWAVFLWGMYGVVKMLLLGDPFTGTAYPYLLLIGGPMTILFAAPTWGPLTTIAVLGKLGVGVAGFPLSALGTLGDTISYVRLMALAVASTALAVAFNDMAASLPFPAGIPVLVIGHGMNVALSVVALLAHGVRLNMLEFSNNLGMQWSGYPYNPFSTIRSEEN